MDNKNTTPAHEVVSLQSAVRRWKGIASLLALLLVFSGLTILNLTLPASLPNHPIEAPDVAARAADALRAADYVTARDLFSEEAEQGSAVAQYMLGQLYANGQGVNQDYRAAFQWFKRAAEQDEPRAQYALASMYAYGQGVMRDDAKAAVWRGITIPS